MKRAKEVPPELPAEAYFVDRTGRRRKRRARGYMERFRGLFDGRERAIYLADFPDVSTVETLRVGVLRAAEFYGVRVRTKVQDNRTAVLVQAVGKKIESPDDLPGAPVVMAGTLEPVK